MNNTVHWFGSTYTVYQYTQVNSTFCTLCLVNSRVISNVLFNSEECGAHDFKILDHL